MLGILMSNQRRSACKTPRGGMLVEASLVLSFIIVPLLLGVSTYGFNIVRAIQANQINRDAGHMFARGVDFTGDVNGLVNRSILFKMAPALQTTTSSGTADLILSMVQYLNSATTCPTPCNNLGHVVFVQQIALGNSALHASAFGTVPAGSMGTDGKVTNRFTDTAVRADGVLNYLVMSDGDTTYISETYFSTADLAIPGFPSPVGTYARAFF